MARVNGFLVCENTEFIKPPLNELEEKMSIIGPLSNGVLKYIPTHLSRKKDQISYYGKSFRRRCRRCFDWLDGQAIMFI